MQKRMQRRKLPLRSEHLFGSPERGRKTALLVRREQNKTTMSRKSKQQKNELQ